MFHKLNSKWAIELLSFFPPNSEKIHVPFPPHHPGDFTDSIYLHFIQEFSELFPSAWPRLSSLQTFSLYYWPSPAVTCICIKERPQFCLEQANYIKTWYKYWAHSLKKLLNTLYFYFLNSLELKYEKYEHLQLSTKLYKIEIMKLYKIEVTAVYLHFICCTGWVGRVQTKADLPWCRSGLSFPVHH